MVDRSFSSSPLGLNDEHLFQLIDLMTQHNRHVQAAAFNVTTYDRSILPVHCRQLLSSTVSNTERIY